MTRSRFWPLGLCALMAAGLVFGAATPTDPSKRYTSADEAAAKIDRHIEAAWKKANVTPAAVADDHEFVRRVYLDLAGRIPTVSEARAFLADKRPDRRTRLVEKLLDSTRFVTHFTTVYRNLLLPEANANFGVRFQVPNFERWLGDQFEAGRGLDAMVKDLITAPVAGGAVRTFPGNQPQQGSPSAFYFAKEFQPEEIAGAVSRHFLGVNLACAQCHNHPFADWKRDQFWSFAAFFSGIRQRRQGDFVLAQGEQADKHEIDIPNTDRKVKAAFLDGKKPEIKSGMKSREVLADWMTSKSNPYFARAAVNRMWAHLFGTGLIEPLDEMSGTESKASHPELLDELAKAFAENGFDLKWLIRAITATKAYHLSSLRSAAEQDDATLFARMQLRGLTPEQLFDSLATATGYQEGPQRSPFILNNTPRSEFLSKFSNSADRPTEVQTSILQALAMMNGQVTANATSLEASETLAAVADAPFMGTPAKIEALYLATLSRKPTTKEISRLVRYVESGGTSTAKEKRKRQSEALADVFWALVNSGEFKFNH